MEDLQWAPLFPHRHPYAALNEFDFVCRCCVLHDCNDHAFSFIDERLSFFFCLSTERIEMSGIKRMLQILVNLMHVSHLQYQHQWEKLGMLFLVFNGSNYIILF